MSLVVLLSSYALGCLCTGWFLVRLRLGKDIRTLGSGSVGARNVGRWLGTWGFAATLIGDAVKGALAVWLARHFTGDARMEVLAGGGVIAGHIWPVQLRFRGGKGMSTVLGALLVFDAVSVLIYLLLTGACWLLLRNPVLSGMMAVALMPPVFLVRGADAFVMTGVIAVAAMILFAHRKNIADEMSAMPGLSRSSTESKPSARPHE